MIYILVLQRPNTACSKARGTCATSSSVSQVKQVCLSRQTPRRGPRHAATDCMQTQMNLKAGRQVKGPISKAFGVHRNRSTAAENLEAELGAAPVPALCIVPAHIRTRTSVFLFYNVKKIDRACALWVNGSPVHKTTRSTQEKRQCKHAEL